MKRITALAMGLAMMTLMTMPVNASGSGKVVRVGWYESPFSYVDENGRRTGYDYVYEQKLINDLKRAVRNEEFEVYFQPQYDIQCDPPVLKSAEALVRWRHPELGMIFPGDFIPLFEEHGMIDEVDKCVWKKAAKQLAYWKSKFGMLLALMTDVLKNGQIVNSQYARQRNVHPDGQAYS